MLSPPTTTATKQLVSLLKDPLNSQKNHKQNSIHKSHKSASNNGGILQFP